MENQKKGILYIIATPIGNLEDITLRAIRILKKVDLIAAEDTRHTLKLLNHLEISKPLISYHRHNEEIRTEELIKELKTGKNIGLVSDAGTPGICDPGEEIIKKCIEEILQNSENLKGEIVLIIEGNKEIEEENSLNNLTIEEHYKFYENQGLSKKDIIKKIAKDRNMNKNDVYQKFI